MKDLGKKYYGQVVIVEEFSREPQIVLSRYDISDLNGNMISDFDEKLNHRILIDTSKCDEIRLVYDKESKYLLYDDME
jgi:hypothetical protein